VAREIDAPMPGPANLPTPVGVRVQNPNVGETRPPARQSTGSQGRVEPTVTSPSLSSSFPALEDNGPEIPPDTQGVVGLNHLMVALNTQMRIQTKAGATLSTVALNTFWQSLGNPAAFDPKLIYDPYGNRWVFISVADGNKPTSSILVAASATSDPTGGWTAYKIKADDNSLLWADYPSVGFNAKWVVVTVNIYDFANPPNLRYAKVFALNKAELYTGGFLHWTFFQDPSGF